EEIETIASEERGGLPPGIAKGPEPAQPDITLLGKYLRGPRDISSLAILGIFCLGLVAFLYLSRAFCLPVILALILSVLLKPVVRSFARFHIPPSIGAAIALALVLGLLGSGVSQVRQPAGEWFVKVPESWRKIELKAG